MTLLKPSFIRQIDLQDVRAELAERHLHEYVKFMWTVLEPETEYLDNWHISAICEHLEAVDRNEIKNLIITIPPRHSKSLLVAVFWPTWSWIKRPHMRWLCASYSSEFSTRDSLKCRRLIESQRYQKYWGDSYSLLSDQNRKTRFENDKSGFRVATSVGGAATGEGGDRVIVDDIMKADEAASDVKRETANAWWFQTMQTRLNNPRTGSRVIIMQRLHENDVVGAVHDRMEEGGEHYEHLSLPMRYESSTHCTTSIGFSDPRTEQGELLWKSKMTEQEAEELTIGLGSYAAAAQFQQRPAPLGGGIFQDVWWNFWVPWGQSNVFSSVQVMNADGEFIYKEPIELPPDYQLTGVQSWDLAFKDKESSSNTAGQVWGWKDANFYLIDEAVAKMDAVKSLAAIKSVTNSYPWATAKLIEDKANGPAVISMLNDKIPGIIPFPTEGDKVARALAAQPFVESGNFYLPHPHIAPWVREMISEFSNFPYGTHDDRVDALSQMVQYYLSIWGKKKPTRGRSR